jgi:hypothetical protein
MSVPIFDPRAAATFFTDALALARLYCPQWALPDDDDVTPAAIARDPGLVLLELFSLLGQDLASVLNAIPAQRQLALYRFLDMTLRPAACASAPIQFSLAPKRTAIVLPKGTTVSAPSAQGVRFETNADVQVLPATLSAVLTVVPRLDRYWDLQSLWQGGNSAPAFPPGDADESDVELSFAHCLMIGDPTLFDPAGGASRMTLIFSGERLAQEFFLRWYDGALNPLLVSVESSLDQRTCRIEFAVMPSAPGESITALHASISALAGRQLNMTDPYIKAGTTTPLNWVVCAPRPDWRIVPALNGGLPRIDSIWCDFGTLSTAPQQAVAGAYLIDLNNGAYAFGKVPAQEGCFNIRCDAAFSAQGAPVSMEIDIRPITKKYPVEIKWEYWNETGWYPFAADGDPYRFVDGTNGLTESGTVSFLCPPVTPATVAGTLGFWIRARIAEGNYGDAADGFDPPFVYSLTITYRSGGVPASVWTHNAFELELAYSKSDFFPVPSVEPYKALAEEGPSLYLAFDAAGLLPYGLGQRLTLYVDIDPRDEHIGYGDAGQWQWFDATTTAWLPLTIDVGEAGLARSGTLSFEVPATMQGAVLFSQTACWFRALCPREDTALRLRGIYPNTVSGCNRETYLNEVLGSSNGQPGQRFVLGQVATAPTGTDQVLLAVSEDPQYTVAISVIEPTSAVSPAIGANQTQQQTVRYPWTRVDSFVGRGPNERIFTVDVLAGAILFGDGNNGKIPPPGPRNVVATRYAVTRGSGGNLGPGTLTNLYSSTPGITQVTNPVAARGGADAEVVPDLAISGPGRVRANDRVVSAADAEALGPFANAGVRRVRAIEHIWGGGMTLHGVFTSAAPLMSPDDIGLPQLDLVVLAASNEPEPLTPMSMLDDVLAYVRDRSTPALAARTSARRPAFKRINVAVLLETNEPKAQWPALQATITEQLTQFLHPSQGGADSLGWPIGEPMRYMAVRLFLQGCQSSVTSVLALALCGQTDDVTLQPYEAPSAGTIDLRFAEAQPS